MENDPQIFKNDLKSFKSDPKSFKSDPKVLKSDPKILKSDPKILKSDPKILKSDPKILKSDPKILKSDPKILKSDPKILKSDPKILKNVHFRFTHIFNPKKVPFDDNAIYRCDCCPKAFHHWHSLEAHQLIHTGQRTAKKVQRAARETRPVPYHGAFNKTKNRIKF